MASDGATFGAAGLMTFGGLTFAGEPIDLPLGYEAPKELAIHTELLRARPDLGAVVHAHPRSALLAGLAGLTARPVFGAYNIPAMRTGGRWGAGVPEPRPHHEA